MSGTAKAPALPGRAPNKTDLAGLAASWITPELAAAARLRRVNREEGGELVLEESRRSKVDCAGLAFPYFWPGESRVREWRIRRDHPDIELRPDGSKRERRKYMGAPGRSSIFYFAPGVTPEQLENPAIPVVIVEGEKKTLALQRLAMHDRTEEQGPRWIAIGISGVWNWRRTRHEHNALAGTSVDFKEPIEDFGRITWARRQVYICFDADVAVNKEVHRARWALARELMHGRKATVRYVEIPRDAEQKGIDDLLGARGPEAVLPLLEAAVPADVVVDVHRVIDAAEQDLSSGIETLYEPVNIGLFAHLSDLEWVKVKARLRRAFDGEFRMSDFEKALKETRLARELERRATHAQPPRDTGLEFVSNEFGIWQWTFRDNRRIARQLTNFEAVISSYVRRDDGLKPEPSYRIQARMGESRPCFTLDAEELMEMRWPIKAVHGTAAIMPGVSAATMLYAIQSLSTEIKSETIYLHTGWRWMEREQQWVYLHAGGAISEDGNSAGVLVELDDKLGMYRLPDPAESQDALRSAIGETLQFLTLAPDHITFPLFAGAFRTVLGKVNLGLFAVGPTQVGKTQLAALIQQMFGRDFAADNLPASWIDTANALESKLFIAKDAICVVDDFNPIGADAEVLKTHSLADRVLRSQGNRSSRGRMDSSLSMRPSRWPRGMILATGEDLPRYQSCRARIVAVEVEPGMVKFGAPLTAAQQAAAQGAYALAMAGFLQWVAPEIGSMEETLRERLALYRKRPRYQDVSQRAPDNMTQLALGFEYFLRYAVARQAITATQAEALQDRADAAFFDLLRDQARQQRSSEPCRMYVEGITSALSSGRAHLANPEGQEPSNYQAWGWREERLGDTVIRRPMGERLGWVDGEDVYLEPRAAFAAAKRAAREAGENLTVSVYTMNKRLRERGYLAEWDQVKKENTVRRTLEGLRRNVVALRPGVIHGRKPANPADPPTNPPTTSSLESMTYEEMGGLAGFEPSGNMREPIGEEVAL